VSQIPPGKVTTYKLLAKAINCGSTQAVGQALRCNPFAPKVPCHRVISTDLSIGGFSGARSGELIDKKLALLAAEGVQFQDGHLADHTAIFRFN
jgi:methylated-DNA-[protein]-cysteine S-methyltransferase